MAGAEAEAAPAVPEATVPRQWSFGAIGLLTDQCKSSMYEILLSFGSI